MMKDKIPTADEIRKSFERLQKDVRMRAIAQQAVAWAMDEHGPINPEKAQREAHDIASLAAHFLVSRIFIEDAELRELKAENERLRELAFVAGAARPVQHFFAVDGGSETPKSAPR
jgi:hypothetical protein